jgi:RimJ/RimL family protein N-acetyltransferase
VDDEAGAIDLFIGETDYLYQGLGAVILKRFLDEEIFGRIGCRVGIIAPEPKNRAAIRIYEKAGFRYVKTVNVSGEPGAEYIMRITRGEMDDQ